MVSQLGAIAAGQVDRPTYITVLLIGPTNTMDQVGGENQNLMQGYSWPDKAELKISANPKVVGGFAGRTSKIFASPGGMDLMMILMVTMMMMVMMTMVMVVSSADL